MVEWSIRWWRWLLSIPRTENPLFDTTGKNSSLHQEHEEVFFLCQTLGNSKSQLVRRAIIPRNKVLFMPIINWISVSGVDGETLEELSSVAQKKIDAVSDLRLKLNEIEVHGLSKFRTHSHSFEIILSDDNVLSMVSGRRLCVSDGFWVFLRPVNNRIVLSSYGSCSSGANKIGITYDLSIL